MHGFLVVFWLTKRWQGDMFQHLMNEYSIVSSQAQQQNIA
jgi:hypothetical protein